MPETAFRTSLLNPDFILWDRGFGPFTSSGFTANGWKLERTGGAGVVSVTRGTTSTTTALRKWLRNRPSLQLDVDAAYDQEADTAVIRQRIELGDRLGGQVGRLTVWATGPEGASFEFGIGGFYETCTTRGTGTLEPAVFERAVSDPSTTYQFIDIFANPEPDNVFEIGFVQLEWRGSYTKRPPYPPQIRNHVVERQLMNRHIVPVGRGMIAEAVSTTEVLVPVHFPAEVYSDQNEKQSVTVDATGGTWTWTWEGDSVSGLAYNLSASALEDALEAHPDIESGDINVTGGPGSAGGGTPYVIEFKGRYAGYDVAQATTSDSLTGGAGTATVATTQTSPGLTAVSRTTVPTWKPMAASAVSATAATYTIENEGPWGCAVKIAGFTGLTPGDRGYLATDVCCLLEAAL